jgi:hypothetical protein
MKGFRQWLSEVRGGDYVVVNKKTGVVASRNNKKNEPHALFGTERDAWDHADRLTGYGKHEYIVKHKNDVHLGEETETADQIKRKIVQKHAGHFPQAAQDYLHKSKTYGNKAYDHLEAEHGIKIGHAKSAIDNIKRDMKSSFGSSGPSLNAAGRINRYLNQKTIGPRGNR